MSRLACVVDTTKVGQVGALRPAAGRAVTWCRLRAPAGFGLGVVAAALLVGGCSAPGSTTTVLREPRGVTVTTSTGAPRTAADGLRLRTGDLVAVSAAGAATLATGGRQVLLGAGGAVRVVDAQTMDLRRGDVLVDRRRGPSMRLRLDELEVSDVGTGVVRVDRDFSTRVAAYSGGATVTTGTGRQLRVTALHEVAASAALLGAEAPLRLTGDAWDRRADAGLVRDDAAITAQATAVDGAFSAGQLGGPAVVQAARFATGTATSMCGLPVAAGASRQVLSLAIARADHPETAVAARCRSAAALHDAGGSWGVVARLLDASTTAVLSAVDALLTLPAAPEGSGPSVASATPGTTSVPAGTLAAPTSGPVVRSGTAPTAPVATGAPRPRPTSSASAPPGVLDVVGRLLPPLPVGVSAPGLGSSQRRSG